MTSFVAALDVTLQWFDKQVTRLPEAIMFEFRPTLRSDHKFRLSKVGYDVDPMNVVKNGSQYQHGDVITTLRHSFF